MFRTLLAFLQKIYVETYLDTLQKFDFVWDHGDFLDSIRSGNTYVLIYALRPPFQKRFGLVHFEFDNPDPLRVDFVSASEIAQYIPNETIEELVQKANSGLS